MVVWRIRLAVVLAAIWYPHSLWRNLELGYDFPIYYAGPGHPGWLYQDWLTIFFEPLRALPMDRAWGLYYLLSVLAWVVLLVRLPRSGAGNVLAVLSVYPALLALELGNITIILAAFCLSPWGVAFATCWKPYCAVLFLVHAGRWYMGRPRGGRRRAVEEIAPDIPTHNVRKEVE